MNKVVHAYNSTVHESTGFSPFFLLFGREPTLPIDLMFPREGARPQSHAGYAEKWRGSMQEAYSIAQENMRKAGERGQKHYNQRAWSSVLEGRPCTDPEPIRERRTRKDTFLLGKQGACGQRKKRSK